ncbi:hypothetical protein HDE76_003685 [Rhodanobacter sp. ANJX3]|uniref:hypothetical protein n=1 Tax=Rhodanobacter sp. ANJX3 TaxID=2723083 RepID=UPI001619AD1F|nr:hypothetical protein [Rhodanobacter sp. ANJX3]MBB5360441.1 hypothetical protein [Rhodanobacter sp. ANJX3]
MRLVFYPGDTAKNVIGSGETAAVFVPASNSLNLFFVERSRTTSEAITPFPAVQNIAAGVQRISWLFYRKGTHNSFMSEMKDGFTERNPRGKTLGPDRMRAFRSSTQSTQEIRP